MILYEVLQNNVVTNSWFSSVHDQTYYEPCFGKPDRWVAQANGGTPGEDENLADDVREVTILGKTVTEHHFPAQFAIRSTDITAKLAAQQALDNGIRAQAVGATAIAQVYALNEAKFTAGTLTAQNFQTILADTTLQMIERLLSNGSLKTAKAMIQGYSSQFFTSQDIASVVAILDASGLDS